MGNWLYDKLHPKDEGTVKPSVRYVQPKEIPRPPREVVKEIRAKNSDVAVDKPQKVIIERVTDVSRGSRQDSQPGPLKAKVSADYNIPTLFDDTLLNMIVLDRI